jgi:hypothetical protein
VGGQFLVDLSSVIIVAFDQDPNIALTFLAAMEGSTRTLTEGWRIDGSGQTRQPPGWAAEPYPLKSIAEVSGLPYESVRRHVRKLEQENILLVSRKGVVIPDVVYERPLLRRAITKNAGYALKLVQDCRALEAPLGTGDWAAAPAAIFQVARMVNVHYLALQRECRELLGLTAIEFAVFMAVWSGNLGHLLHSPLDEACGALDQAPPEALRRPVSAYAVGKTLSLPYETARRATLRLAERGIVERKDAAGYILPEAESPTGARRAVTRRLAEASTELARALTDPQFQTA